MSNCYCSLLLPLLPLQPESIVGPDRFKHGETAWKGLDHGLVHGQRDKIEELRKNEWGKKLCLSHRWRIWDRWHQPYPGLRLGDALPISIHEGRHREVTQSLLVALLEHLLLKVLHPAQVDLQGAGQVTNIRPFQGHLDKFEGNAGSI